MSKLSVVLATFNEEKNIGECLKTVKNWADEIIVLDGESTDKTAKIAKKHGAKVFVVPNQPIFHVNKQMAIDKAKGDWILQLDADERVTPKLKEEILSISHRAVAEAALARRRQPSAINHQPVAYYIPRKNFFLGRWMRKGGMYPDPVIRFFKRGKAYLPCKSVHEQMEVKGKVGWLKNNLIHIADPSFSRYLLRSNRYTSLTAQEYLEKNLPINFFTTMIHIIVKPILRFLTLFIRHKGFMDGFPGFVFALYSSLHFATAWVKYWEMKRRVEKRLI